ncbi:hypothetical protein GOP47_0008651 [Adiantum capillus-veneris]|uniref:Uncharacterized protein n=1 Tax=Adiantum capillus-veneris TaxID=13818 RepID=A0A9D4ZKM2_ADICA|nr:hypothetical protein GOP47_0008651 [Adiantum capillus-veneris]
MALSSPNDTTDVLDTLRSLQDELTQLQRDYDRLENRFRRLCLRLLDVQASVHALNSTLMGLTKHLLGRTSSTDTKKPRRDPPSTTFPTPWLS